MENSNQVAEVIGNVKVAKVAKVAKVVEITEVQAVVETIETKVEKIKVDKNKELFATLAKLTNLSVEQLKTIAILNLAKRKVKINLTKFLTQMILNVASSKIEIKEIEAKFLTEMINKISNNTNFSNEQIQDALILKFARTNKKISLKDFMFEFGFQIVTTKELN